MKQLIKVCVDPTTHIPTAICDRDPKSSTPGKMTCCVCSSAFFINVDRLREWSGLLAISGIGSKQIVRNQINELLKEVD